VAEGKPRAEEGSPSGGRRMLRTLGLGLITGAADDDPSAIGTYASAGAAIGPAFLWTAPATFPMMCAVVYLSAKLGQVSGKGLFHVIKDHYSRWILYPALIGVLIGNIIGAGADIGGMSAAIGVLIPIPAPLIIVPMTMIIFALQVWGSYTLIRNVFRWLALTLLAYVGSAILAKPDLFEVLRGTLIPTIQFNQKFLSLVVAVIGTALSAYVYTWQSNQEVEEEIAKGRRRLDDRKGASKKELQHTRADVVSGMFFANLVMYFIMLSTASTLFKAGTTEINTVGEAAQALRPLAGEAAAVLFALGVIGVGVLAVPIMTTGAAYAFSQVMGWKHSLHAKPSEAKRFYAAIGVFTALAMSMNFFGFNPMKALVFAGVVQGFSTPPLLLLIMLMTNNRKIMGNRVNGVGLNILGWITTAAIFAATVGLVITWFM
jgi:NRAMP (natural resistance-associated macrophage protein)-like metal ion transporter